MFFVVVLLSLVGTTLTSSLSKRGGGGAHNVPLINCPTCEHHVCDSSNLIQCEVCQIYIPHENQPPEVVKCTRAGHCHEDNHHHCCDNEGCVAHYFGQLASSTVTQPVSSIGCPRCRLGRCDFNNRDQCSTCLIDLHDGRIPHVHCLGENEHCDPHYRNNFCCSDESCIVQAFGHYYPTSHDTTTTAESATSTLPTKTTAASTTITPHSSSLSLTTTIPTTNASPQTNPTSTGEHKMNLTNQLLNYIPCPVCTHHTCDLANTNLCEACKIYFNHHQQAYRTNCLTVEHCHEYHDRICCTDMTCVENVFGNIPNSGASLNGNRISCPDCSEHGCRFIPCETCVYHDHIDNETQLHPFNTCQHKGECSQNLYICCHDYQCIDKLFGTHFQSTLSTIQSTTNASITSKTTDRASTTKAHALSHATTNASTTSGAATMTTPSRQNTTTGTTTPNIATLVSSNCINIGSLMICDGQPTHHVSGAATSTYRTITTRQQSTAPPTTTSSTIGTNNSCVDELKNCAMFKSMGVCHASPQERTKYDIAFQCKLTCERCNETYELLTTVASTIPTTIGTTQANPTSTDGHIPCPVCTHNVCDHSNTILCEVCQITFNHQPQPQNAKCLNRGQCFEDDSNLCCTDLACVDIILKHLDAVTNYPLIQPVRAFGHNNQTSQSTISTTKSATSTLPTNSSAAATTTTLQFSSLSSTTTVRTTHTSPRKIHASIKRKPEASNIGDLLREKREKEN